MHHSLQVFYKIILEIFRIIFIASLFSKVSRVLPAWPSCEAQQQVCLNFWLKIDSHVMVRLQYLKT